MAVSHPGPADTGGGSGLATHRADVRRRNTEQKQAFAAGKAGEAFPWPDRADDELAAAYESGQAERSRTPSPGGPKPGGTKVGGALMRGASTSVGNDAAGFVLGLLVYVVGLNYLRGGPAGVRDWLRAKFLNQPAGATPKTPAGAVEGPWSPA